MNMNIQKKLKAGAKGLFTQPLFDINLTKMLLNLPISGEWFIEFRQY